MTKIIQPEDLQQMTKETEQPHLNCLEGPDLKGMFLYISPGAVAGRSMDCDIILSDETVSMKHARFELDEDELEVINLSKTNPVYVNGKPVERQVLEPGDRVRIGVYVFVRLGEVKSSNFNPMLLVWSVLGLVLVGVLVAVGASFMNQSSSSPKQDPIVVPVETATQTATPSPFPTRTSTMTLAPDDTATPTPTDTPTATWTPTRQPTDTPMYTSTPTVQDNQRLRRDVQDAYERAERNRRNNDLSAAGFYAREANRLAEDLAADDPLRKKVEELINALLQ